jgi:hypothetical protein
MKPEPEIQPGLRNALNALAEADRGAEAPPELETKLRAAFRNHQRHRGLRIWRWIPAVAAAAILIIVASYRRPAPEAPVAKNIVPAVRPVSPDVRIPAVEPATAARRVARTRKSVSPQEIATDFFPLVAFAPPADGGELVRVSLPASAMREVGLPVREDRLMDRVQADVLVSNGMATAIRFVKVTQ